METEFYYDINIYIPETIEDNVTVSGIRGNLKVKDKKEISYIRKWIKKELEKNKIIFNKISFTEVDLKEINVLSNYKDFNEDLVRKEIKKFK